MDKIQSQEAEKGQIFDHRSMLNFENPNAAYYKQLVSTDVCRFNKYTQAVAYSLITGGQGMQKEFHRIWTDKSFLEYSDVQINFLKEKISGVPLVDLGGGNETYFHMQKFAQKMGASAYINVDWSLRADGGSDPQMNMAFPATSDLTPEMGVALVPSDILEFLSSLQSNSVNVVINGIDNCMESNEEYHRAVAAEIARVTKIEGIAFGCVSECLRYLEDLGMSSDNIFKIKRPSLYLRNVFQKHSSLTTILPHFIQKLRDTLAY